MIAAVVVVFAIAMVQEETDPGGVNSNQLANKTTAPLYITTMTHMEGIFGDDVRENVFTRHVTDIRWAMDLFDEYGAKLTIESEGPFAKANTKWGVPILQEVIDRGHGVGTHCDYGYSPNGGANPTTEELTAYAKTVKRLVDALVGAENNLGNSGCTGEADWVVAAAKAGFKFKSGITGIAYLSMPESARAAGWTDEYIREEGYHEGIPPAFEENIYPLPLKDAKDLVPDDDALIVVMGGELGELSSLAEGRSSCFPSCVFKSDDVQKVIDAIKEADRIRDRSRVAHLNMHIPVKLFTKNNEALFRELLSAIKAYADGGTVVWETQLGAYQGYVEWNK